MQETRILFVHIPKTAGISLFSALASAVGYERALRFPEISKENREKYLGMTDEEVRRYWLLSGHFPLAFYLKKPVRDYQVITTLRDPVDRELSAYFYVKGWKGHPKHASIGQMDLRQFVEHRERQGTLNWQCTMLAGVASFDAAKRAINKHRIIAAPTDYIDDFCRLLERRLSIGPLVMKRENVTKARLGVDEVPADIKCRLKALTGEDQELYLYVKRKFEEDILGKQPA